jgi:predicted transcriptional regulator
MAPCGRGAERNEENMSVLRIGIAPQDEIRRRVLGIAKGEIKPKPSDPTVWFTSMHSLAQALSDENRALLQVIRESKPESISALAAMTGLQQGNLSRTLKTMSRYGLVQMQPDPSGGKRLRPVTRVRRFEIVAV